MRQPFPTRPGTARRRRGWPLAAAAAAVTAALFPALLAAQQAGLRAADGTGSAADAGAGAGVAAGAGAATGTRTTAGARTGLIDAGLVLDGGYTSRGLALGARERGLALGHTEASIAGNIDDRFTGRATAALHRHDGEFEVEVEEAWFETLRLPAGLTLRAGRFLSQIGYLNEQHGHVDDFAERPLMYRAFLGNHYADDGLRLNWVAPTPLYLRFGLEVLAGKPLVATPERERTVGAIALGVRTGGDIGRSQSWQAGFSYLRNRLDPVLDREAGHDHGAEGDGHDHDHGAQFSGRHVWIADGVWKWAPDGNNQARQLRLSGEIIRITEPTRFATRDDDHLGWYLSAVYRFAPQWEAGARHGSIRVSEPHGDHFHAAQMRETDLMIAWKPTHFSALRLQWSRQRDRGGFADAGNAVMLQYVMSLGAHGAHTY